MSYSNTCSIHGEKSARGEKKGEFGIGCNECQKAIKRAREGSDQDVINVRVAIQLERRRLNGNPQFIILGDPEFAVRAMKFLYPPEGVRPDGTRLEVGITTREARDRFPKAPSESMWEWLERVRMAVPICNVEGCTKKREVKEK